MIKNKKGFTLVELLAVIVVLSIIALIGYSVVGDIIGTTEISANKQTVMNYAKAISEARYLYLLKEGTEPNMDKEWINSNVEFSNNNLNCDNIIYSNDELVMTGCKFSGGDDNVYSFLDGKSYVASEYKNSSENLASNIQSPDFRYEEEGDYWYYTKEKNTDVTFSNYIEIDPSKRYLISVDIKTNNPEATFYAGIKEYDEEKKDIVPLYYMYYQNSLSELVEDWNVGDKTVTIKPADGVDYATWKSVWGKTYTENSRRNGFIFWNYEPYGPETYSRHADGELFPVTDHIAEVDDANNQITITLNTAWDGTLKRGTTESYSFESVPKYTKLSRSNVGNDFNYGLLIRKSLPTEYETKSMIISGTIDNGQATSAEFKYFRPGTKYIRLSFRHNVTSESDTTLYVKNILIKEI